MAHHELLGDLQFFSETLEILRLAHDISTTCYDYESHQYLTPEINLLRIALLIEVSISRFDGFLDCLNSPGYED